MPGRALFSLVVDYDGGTYISQVRALTEREALYAWCEKCADDYDVPAEVRPIATALLENLDKDTHEPVALQGLTAAWCASTLLDDKLALINVIKTTD